MWHVCYRREVIIGMQSKTCKTTGKTYTKRILTLVLRK